MLYAGAKFNIILSLLPYFSETFTNNSVHIIQLLSLNIRTTYNMQLFFHYTAEVNCEVRLQQN